MGLGQTIFFRWYLRSLFCFFMLYEKLLISKFLLKKSIFFPKPTKYWIRMLDSFIFSSQTYFGFLPKNMQAWKNKLPWLFWHGFFCKFIKVLEKYHLRVIWFAVVAPNDHVRTFKIAWVHAYLCVIKNAFVLCSLKFMGHLCLLYQIWVLIFFSYLLSKLLTELAINAKILFTR